MTADDHQLIGELITQTFAHDGGRTVTVYLPPIPPVSVVYAGDGQLFSTWGGALEAAGYHSTMIVAVDRTDDPDEMARIREYSPGFAPDVFAAHEHFVVDEVTDWVTDRFSVELAPSHTAVAGVSASAELALALGLRHRDRFGALFAASPGGGFRPDNLADDLPDDLGSEGRSLRCYLTSGTDEPWFGENTRRWVDALQAAGAEVVSTTPPGDHGDPFWCTEFVNFVGWAFHHHTH